LEQVFLVDLPRLQLPDRFALHRQLDVGVRCVNFRACGMAHERHADLLQDAGLHQAGVKRVAKVMEANVADSGVLEPRFPRALHNADRLAVKDDNQAFRLAVLEQERE
jgi:hypothetical protein